MNNKLEIKKELEKIDFSMKILCLKLKKYKENSNIYQNGVRELVKEYLLYKLFLIKYFQGKNEVYYCSKYSDIDNIEDILIRASYLEPKVKTKTK